MASARCRIVWALIPIAGAATIACSIFGDVDELKGNRGCPEIDSDAGASDCLTDFAGACAKGRIHCDGNELTCVPLTAPTKEVCNGIDDDCNGIPDDGFAGAGNACTVPNVPANSPCAAGLTNCLSGPSNCTQVVFPKPEECDGLDNDCDGIIDNPEAVNGKPCNTGQLGLCSTGLTSCTSWIPTCIPQAPQVETCNGIDDDCNGVVDDVSDVSSQCASQFPLATQVAAWSCATSPCSIATCSFGFGDCNGKPDDGCETDLSKDCTPCGCLTTSFGENDDDSVRDVATDTFVDLTNPTFNYGNSTKLLVDAGGTPSIRAVALVRFELSSISNVKQVVSASLHITISTGYGTLDTVSLRQVFEAWEEGTKDKTAGIPNFDLRKAPAVPWSTSGALPPSSSAKTASGTFKPTDSAPRLQVVAIDAHLVDDWVRGAKPNYGLAITNETSDGVYFESSESTTGNRPSLHVTYVP